jgi:hypothetical protein
MLEQRDLRPLSPKVARMFVLWMLCFGSVALDVHLAVSTKYL